MDYYSFVYDQCYLCGKDILLAKLDKCGRDDETGEWYCQKCWTGKKDD